MRVICVARERQDYSGMVEEWVTEFRRRTNKEIEMIDPDGREGVSFCQAYDVVEYPTFLALNDDGAVMAEWRGRELPLFDDVAYWA